MKIIQIIDSLELNGGSTTFLEYVSAMRRYWTDATVTPYVVSKTGLYGREELVDETLPKSYGIDDLKTYSYDTFNDIRESIRDTVIFHHVLGHTRPIFFHKSCKYILVNHTATNIKRLPRFKAAVIVCVSDYFTKRLRIQTRIKARTILNGCEDYYGAAESKIQDNRIIIGRCQRVVPSKMKEITSVQGCVNYVVGPVGKNFKKRKEMKDCIFVGPVFDKQEKLKWVSSFDVYLHNAGAPEGASMAILEALSCGVPVLARNVGGGVLELVRDKRNGRLFRSAADLKKVLTGLISKDIKKLRVSVREDFLQRLHIKHSLVQYRKLAEDGMAFPSPRQERAIIDG